MVPRMSATTEGLLPDRLALGTAATGIWRSITDRFPVGRATVPAADIDAAALPAAFARPTPPAA